MTFKPALTNLTQISNRISYLHLTECKIVRSENSLCAVFHNFQVQIPVGVVACLILGHGTSITQQAALICAEMGTGYTWAMSDGSITTGFTPPLSNSSDLAFAQAAMVSNRHSRLEAAKFLYSQRFPHDNIESLNARQLLGLEGREMKQVYVSLAEQFEVPWQKRIPRDAPDLVNRYITIGNGTLYSLARTVVFNLGLSPSLGVLHRGHRNAFLFDIADVYKLTTSIPVAFKCSSAQLDLKNYRRMLRQRLREEKVLKDMPRMIGEMLHQPGHPLVQHLQEPQVAISKQQIWKF